MQVAIRTDSSLEIGSGHLMRCLALAESLREKRADVSFICRKLNIPSPFLIKKNKFNLNLLPNSKISRGHKRHFNKHKDWLGVPWETDAIETKRVIMSNGGNIDLLIVDHYGLDERWEKQMRPLVKRIMVIDDLADRPHDCDILLDQNYHSNMLNRYNGLVPLYCKKFLGPKYALLRKEFFLAHKIQSKRNGIIKRIFIFFGGSDLLNITVKALKAIQKINKEDILVDVVVGSSNPNKKHIKHLCRTIPNTTFYFSIENIAELMEKSDIAIGAGGINTWERCILGLPTVVITTAKNQVEHSISLSSLGAILYLGYYNNVSVDDIIVALKNAIKNPKVVRRVGEVALKLMDNNFRHYHSLLNYILDETKVKRKVNICVNEFRI